MPAAVLVVSGGHTSLYFVPDAGTYRLVGRTRDDAAGEAYDKVAKLLGLGYPGGPGRSIGSRREGRDDRFSFPVTRLTHADRNAPRATGSDLLPAEIARRTDFSFSGLKTAVLRLVQERQRALARRSPAASGRRRHLRRFQRVVVDALLDRTFEAARWLGRTQHRHRRRGVRQQPPARGRRSARREGGHSGFRSAAGALDRQRGDDRRRRAAPPRAALSPRRLDFNAEASLCPCA